LLFRRRVLDGIRAGEVTLAFRRWDRPRAKAGGRQRTAVGELAIDSVEQVERADITTADARAAGHRSLDDLLAELDARGDAPIWRVRLRWAGEDPRRSLRERADLDAAEVEELLARLDRFDRASRHGAWTRETLELIAARPAVRAVELAATVGREKQPFKLDVRKLKELGLTESLQRGYRLSPRGRSLLSAPYWLLTYAVRVCLAGAETGGVFSMAEYLKPAGDWTPLHIHHRESQTTYVLEGEATVHLPEGPHVARPGECVHQPAGVPHTEAITSSGPARVLDVYAPAGFERWVTRAGRPADGMVLPPEPETPDEQRIAELVAVAEELGIEVIGAPGEVPY
jgi:mannose-6-phosphate isomerase-like protein (cupin superfamily)